MENYFLPYISIEYWSGFSLHPYYDDAGDGICPFFMDFHDKYSFVVEPYH